MIAVLDTSAAVRVLTDRQKSKVMTTVLSDAEWVIAPTLFIPEITNVFWKYFQHDVFPLDQCERHIRDGIDLVDDFISETDLHREAFALACSTRQSAYDMFFLVLARRYNALLLSIDSKLILLAGKHSIKTIDME
jgi:predicted nucleic acid-binding protein